MDISCPRCGGLAEPAGHEDARAFFQCPICARVWATHISALADRGSASAQPAPRVLIADDSPEMLGLLTAWGLSKVGLARVEAWVELGNAPSLRALTASGYVREGLLRSFLSDGDRRTDAVVLSRIL